MKIVCLTLLCCLLSACATISAKKATFAPRNNGQVSDAILADRNIEPVTYKTTDGETIYGLYLPNNKSQIITLFFHGNGGNIHNRILALEKLHSLGSSVLGISYRGYLNSTGEPSEEGVYEDARSALTYINSELNFKQENVLVLGRSLGSAVAMDLAQRKNFAGLILVSPFSSAQDLYDTLNPLFKSQIKNEDNYIGTAFRSSDKAEHIIVPTLVIHGTEDNLIPYRLGRVVFDALPGKKSFASIEGAGHNDFGYRNRTEFDEIFWQAIEKFLREEKILSK